ncbi:unnamed protein product, partial [Ectocarpus fasciculatus]
MPERERGPKKVPSVCTAVDIGYYITIYTHRGPIHTAASLRFQTSKSVDRCNSRFPADGNKSKFGGNIRVWVKNGPNISTSANEGHLHAATSPRAMRGHSHPNRQHKIRINTLPYGSHFGARCDKTKDKKVMVPTQGAKRQTSKANGERTRYRLP